MRGSSGAEMVTKEDEEYFKRLVFSEPITPGVASSIDAQWRKEKCAACPARGKCAFVDKAEAPCLNK